MIKKGISKPKANKVTPFQKIKMKFMSLNFNEKLNSVIAVVSLLIAFASLIIAIIAIKSITKIEGFEDLLNRTAENNTQLTKVVSELQKQYEVQQLTLESYKVELNELKTQTKSLSNLQQSNNDQLSIQRNVEKSDIIRDALILGDICLKLQNYNFIPENAYFYHKSYRTGTIKYLTDLKSLIQRGLNTYLLKIHEDVYQKWVNFDTQIDFILMILTQEQENIITKYYGIPMEFKNLTLDPSLPPMTLEESTLSDLKDFKETSDRFFRDGREQTWSIKEVQYYMNKLYYNYKK